MDNNNYCVYVHTNKINGKKYFGITCKEPEIRWSNGRGYIHNEHFYNSICKYGWNNFEHEILFDNLTEDDACKIEVEMIKTFRTQDSSFGYNIMSGGTHSLHTESSKEKMKNNNTRRRKVSCYDNVFNSVKECSKYYGIHENSMRDWLMGRTAMPEYFYNGSLRYYDENPVYKKIKTKAFQVICDDIEFKSVSECSKYYNVSEKNMRYWLSGEKDMPIYFQRLCLRYGNIYRYIILQK